MINGNKSKKEIVVPLKKTFTECSSWNSFLKSELFLQLTISMKYNLSITRFYLHFYKPFLPLFPTENKCALKIKMMLSIIPVPRTRRGIKKIFTPLYLSLYFLDLNLFSHFNLFLKNSGEFYSPQWKLKIKRNSLLQK